MRKHPLYQFSYYSLKQNQNINKRFSTIPRILYFVISPPLLKNSSITIPQRLICHQFLPQYISIIILLILEQNKMIQIIPLQHILHLQHIHKFILNVNIQSKHYKQVDVILYENIIYINIKGNKNNNNEERKMILKIKLDFSVVFDIQYQKAQILQNKNDISAIKLIKSNQQITIQPFLFKEPIKEFKQELQKRINQKYFHQYFKAIKKIGKGSFASVFLIEQIGSDKKYAVKAFCKDTIYNQQRGKQSLINQVAIMRKLTHKNLMKIYGVYETQNSVYIVLELLQGGNLTQRLQNKKKISSFEIKAIMKGILQGLQAMHKKQIMHRDIKPDNIIFHTQGDLSPVIADFGLSQVSSAPTYLYTRCGTPGFVAPQIVSIKEPQTKYTCSCDLFSVGIIFHLLLFNKPLFGGNSFAEILEQNKICNVDLEGDKYDLLSDSTLNLLKRLLQKDPNTRITATQALQHPYFSNQNVYIRKSLMKRSLKLDTKFLKEQKSSKIGSVVMGNSFIIKKISRQDSCLKFNTKQNIITGKTQQMGNSLQLINSPQLKKKMPLHKARPSSRFKNTK